MSSFEHHWSNHLVEQEDNDYDVVLHVAEAVACVTVVADRLILVSDSNYIFKSFSLSNLPI